MRGKDLGEPLFDLFAGEAFEETDGVFAGDVVHLSHVSEEQKRVW